MRVVALSLIVALLGPPAEAPAVEPDAPAVQPAAVPVSDEEALEASQAGQRDPQPKRKGPDKRVAIGATLITVGGVSMISALVLIGLSGVEAQPACDTEFYKPCGTECIPNGLTCDVEREGPQKPGLLVGGIALIVVATGALIGGGVSLMRAKQAKRVVWHPTPTGIQLRF